MVDQSGEVAAVRRGGGHAGQQRDTHLRRPMTEDVFFANPRLAGTQGHGVQLKAVPLRHARQYEVQTGKAVGGDEKPAAGPMLQRQGVDDAIQRRSDIFRVGQRARVRLNERAPRVDEMRTGAKRQVPLRIIGRAPPRGEVRQRSANEFPFVGEHADGVVQKIARAVRECGAHRASPD